MDIRRRDLVDRLLIDPGMKLVHLQGWVLDSVRRMVNTHPNRASKRKGTENVITSHVNQLLFSKEGYFNKAFYLFSIVELCMTVKRWKHSQTLLKVKLNH